MKIICSVLSFLTLTLVITPLDAQILKNMGIKAGASVSSLTVSDVRPDQRTGFLGFGPSDVMVSPSVSLFADLLNGDNFALQTELLYLRRGGGRTDWYYAMSQMGFDAPATLYRYTVDCSLQCLELAVLAQPRLPLTERGVVVYGQFGLKASAILTSSYLAPIDHVDRVQPGYLLGIGADLGRVFDNGLFVEVRFAGDFQAVYEGPFGNFWSRTWILSLGTTL